jgi:hypothetical protein
MQGSEASVEGYGEWAQGRLSYRSLTEISGMEAVASTDFHRKTK